MEFWDIYDKDKKPTGRTMKRNDWCLKDGEYHLTVLGVVARPDGTFLITKRVMTKAWAPGCWEVSGGAAQAGEESYEAVLREVKEETGLDVRNAEGGYLFTYKRENPGEGDNYFVDVYRFVMDIDDKDLKLQTEETDGYMFATLEQIKGFAAEDKFLHYESIKKVFEFCVSLHIFQDKTVFMVIQQSVLFHLSQCFGQGAPVKAEIVSKLLTVQGNIDIAAAL